jgi:hypothetical protein
MTNEQRISVSIELTATQIDDVLRTASRSRAPSVTTLIAETLRAPRSEDEDERSQLRAAVERLSGYLPIGRIDPRLSRSLLRGLSLLTCFGPEGEARGIVEIAEALGMSPSTTHRYALTLVELGLLERCPDSRKYRLPGPVVPRERGPRGDGHGNAQPRRESGRRGMRT